MSIRRRYSAIICTAPDLCEPCRSDLHDQCSWDGEPNCLCETCPPGRKTANLAALDRSITETA